MEIEITTDSPVRAGDDDGSNRGSRHYDHIRNPAVINAPGISTQRHQAGQKQEMFSNFERKLKRVKWSALLTACFYSTNRFLGFCALTWASAVILGALLSELSHNDFYSVTFLLLLIAIRLFVGISFGHYIARKLVRGAYDPTFTPYQNHNVPFAGKTHTDILFVIFRLLDQVIQVAITGFDMVFACRRFLVVLLRQNHLHTKFDVVDSSLLIFYGIASLDGLIAFLAVVHCKVLLLFHVQSYSLHDYYDEMVCRYMNIFWTGMGNGMLFASDHDILAFVFRSLAQLYRQSNNKYILVRQLYEDLAVYVYSYPQGQGFEAARVALASNDAYARKAAVNMLYLWVGMDYSQEILRHHKNLLSALAQALQDNIQGTGCVSALCFEKLGQSDASRTLCVKSAKSGERLVHILIDLVCIDVFEREEENEAKEYIRALIPLLPLVMRRISENDVDSAGCSQAKLGNLRQALTKILERGSDQNKHVQKGTLAVTASAFDIIKGSPFSPNQIDSLLRAEPRWESPEFLDPQEEVYLISVLTSPDRVFSVEWKNRVLTAGNPKWPSIPLIARRKSFLVLAFSTVAAALGLYFYYVVSIIFRLSLAAAFVLLLSIHATIRFFKGKGATSLISARDMSDHLFNSYKKL